MIDLLRNLFFARKCFLCGATLSEKDAVFCPQCRPAYDRLKHAFCIVCGHWQFECHCTPRDFGSASYRHLFAFDSGLSRKLIYILKQRNAVPLQRFFARELCGLASPSFSREPGMDVVTYAPRTSHNVRVYGFDQAKQMAKYFAKRSHLPFVSLYRHAGSAEQKALAAAERTVNARTSYQLRYSRSVEGKHLYIIDDVVTTGSTAARLIRLAREAGASQVTVLSVARTPLKGGRR